MQINQEWAAFRSRGRIIALAAAVLITVLLGVFAAFTNRSSCSEGTVEVACPADPVGPQGEAVADQFAFAHRPLGTTGSITVRLTSMTGTITYPPPNHDEIVPGLVPWAKAGITIKAGLTRGSSYAALMLTGSHGVRMQHDYVYDTPGQPGDAMPRWLRLTRSGDTITGDESADGQRWATVGTVQLSGLPDTVRVGLFATSPGDLTITSTGASQVRFTQAKGVFDNVTVDGSADAKWTGDIVGEMGGTDWEKYHQAPGFTESNGTFTVVGSGDIGPVGAVGGHPVEDTLIGLIVGVVVVMVVAVTFARDVTSFAARAVVVGAAGFVTGLVAAGVTVPVGVAVLRATGSVVLPVSILTDMRVVVGVAALVAVFAVFAFALGALLRRWVAILLVFLVVAVPYVLGVTPLLPDEVSAWLLSLSPAAGFAAEQTIKEFPQVVANYAAPGGYFPLPGWAGFLVLCAYTAAVVWLVVRRRAATDWR